MMKIYLVFLLAIIVTCQANEVSWSRQLNAYPGLRKNDLNQRPYLDGGSGRSDRSIGRTAYDGSVHLVRTRDLNDDVRRAGNPSRSNNVRTPSTLVVEKLPTRTRNSQTPNAWRVGPNKGSDIARASSQAQEVPDKNHKATLTRAHKVVIDPLVWNRARVDDAASDGHIVRQTRSLSLETSGVNQAPFVRSTNNIGQGANVLRSSDLNRVRSYGQENYHHIQADYARRNLVSSVPVVRAGNNLNNLDGVAQGLNIEKTSYSDRSPPIVRAGNYGPYKPKPDVTQSKPKKDISTADSIKPVAQMSRHGYSHPDPEIERKQREQNVPSLLDIAEISAIEDSNNSARDYTKDINLPGFDPNDEYSLLSDTYRNPNDGYKAPYDSYGINDGSEISNQVPYNGYSDMDYNMLVPAFDSFRESGVNSITKNKITNSDLIAVYNDSTGQNIYNNTDQEKISDRGGFFNDDPSYTLDHRGFHNMGTFSDDSIDSINNDGTPDVVEINSNGGASMNSNGECYCSTNSGHRVCNCDPNHCEGANCHRVTTQMHTTTPTTCELCKAIETTMPKPFVCDICTHPPPPPPPPPRPPSPPPRWECNYEPYRPKCDPCQQRESSCECKQSCSCGCNSCCTHSCHSCKPQRPSYDNCESGQEFGSNCGEHGNHYHGENGINYYGQNGNSYYGDNGINAYNEYYNNYYKHQAPSFGGNDGGQFHANVQGNAWTGGYAGEGGQITGRGKSSTEQSDYSGGTVALYTDTDLEDAPISSSNNAACSLNSLAASSKIKSIRGNSVNIIGGSVKGSEGSSFKISGGSIKTSGGKSSSSASVFGGTAAHGGGAGNPYHNLFSSFSKSGIFPNSIMGPFGK